VVYRDGHCWFPFFYLEAGTTKSQRGLRPLRDGGNTFEGLHYFLTFIRIGRGAGFDFVIPLFSKVSPFVVSGATGKEGLDTLSMPTK